MSSTLPRTSVAVALCMAASVDTVYSFACFTSVPAVRGWRSAGTPSRRHSAGITHATTAATSTSLNAERSDDDSTTKLSALKPGKEKQENAAEQTDRPAVSSSSQRKRSGTDEESEFATWVEGLTPWPRLSDNEDPVPSLFSSFTSDDASSTSASDSERTAPIDDSLNDKTRRQARPSEQQKGNNPLSNLLRFADFLEAAEKVVNGTDTIDVAGLSVGSKDGELTVDTEAAVANAAKLVENVQAEVSASEPWMNATRVEDFLGWDKFIESIPRTIANAVQPSSAVDTDTNDNTPTIDESADKEKPRGLTELFKMQEQPQRSSSSSSSSSLVPEQTAKEIAGEIQHLNKAAGGEAISKATDSVLKDATSRIEYLVSEAATVPGSVQDIMSRATNVFNTNQVEDLVKAIGRIAAEQGLDVREATETAREATRSAARVVAIANNLFSVGYARNPDKESIGDTPDVETDVRPLFARFPSAETVSSAMQKSVIIKGAEMGTLAGAIYEDTIAKCHGTGHSIVANGTVEDVAWMVTDSLAFEDEFLVQSTDKSLSSRMSQHDSGKIASKPVLTRTITIRGFDASDETVDRERLLNTICTAAPATIDGKPGVLLHSGLLRIAQQVKTQVERYIDLASPNHKIVLNGHSIGGALAVLVLLLLAEERGPAYVQDRILRTYTHGSPPVSTFVGDARKLKINKRRQQATPDKEKRKMKENDRTEATTRPKSRQPTCPLHECNVLDYFGLPSDMVYGYVQPYDPIVRFFSEYDALYPLADDLGADGMTPYANGPPRSLRMIARNIIQSWEGWPVFRDNFRTTNQTYTSVGVQHLLLPDPLRYVNDRFISTNIGVPPTDAIVRVSSAELLPALNATFPLDTFHISLIPQAVRSFVHHFYPAYDATVANYAAKLRKSDLAKAEKDRIKNEPKDTAQASASSLGWARQGTETVAETKVQP